MKFTVKRQLNTPCDNIRDQIFSNLQHTSYKKLPLTLLQNISNCRQLTA